jgi:hypothetical protein
VECRLSTAFNGLPDYYVPQTCSDATSFSLHFSWADNFELSSKSRYNRNIPSHLQLTTRSNSMRNPRLRSGFRRGRSQEPRSDLRIINEWKKQGLAALQRYRWSQATRRELESSPVLESRQIDKLSGIYLYRPVCGC